MCSQSAPHCSMNFASDARFAKSDDSIEGAILGCGSIRCNSSSFPPPMVDQSIDGFPVPLIPTFLSHRPKRKEKKRKNPSEDVCLASSKTLGSKKSCDRKTFWSKRIPDQKPRKDDFFKKNTHTHSSSRQISEQFLFFSEEFSSSSSSSSSLLLLVGFQYERKGFGFSDLKTCQSKLGEFFFFSFFWVFFGVLGFV